MYDLGIFFLFEIRVCVDRVLRVRMNQIFFIGFLRLGFLWIGFCEVRVSLDQGLYGTLKLIQRDPSV